jgi:hypothetical protein
VIEAFAVGVPARDEAKRIVDTIDALAGAAREAPAPVHLVVAADRCADATEALARQAMMQHGSTCFRSATVILVDAGTAGAARHTACLVALRQASADCRDRARIWIATTDADSAVPRSWFALHDAWARRGADGVAGLVELLTDDGPDPAVHRRWRDLVERAGVGHGHPHVHGANLGMRADLWLAAGGFAPVAVGEDRELWRRARALGGSLVGCSDMVVRTSARRRGRTPAGFAGLLAEIERDVRSSR